MIIEPLGDRVLIRPIEEETTTKSGLVIPDTAREKPKRAEVVAVGDDDSIKVRPGDRVLFPPYTGTEVKVDGADHLILASGDLLAVVRDGARTAAA